MVREARENELQNVLELYLDLHETSVPEASEQLLRTWRRILDDPDHHLIVREVEGRIVASCVCVVIPNLSRGARPYALIENMVTRAAERGKGYGTECLRYAEQIARSAGCYKLMLLTGSRQESTLRFYENAGYSSAEKTAFIQRLD